MATTTILDLTEKINQQNGFVVIDLGEWYSGTIYTISSATFSFSTSNDGGEEEGTILPSPLTAINFTSCQVLYLTTNTQVTSFTGGGLFRFNRIGKYLKIEADDIVDKLIVQLYKII